MTAKKNRVKLSLSDTSARIQELEVQKQIIEDKITRA